jgi:predicted RNA polymerase sigma factor
MGADAVDEAQLWDLIPGVLAALVHRGADFATAEDAVQEALVRAIETWGTWSDQYPDDPKGWLITTAWRRVVDLARSDTARRRRELRVSDGRKPSPSGNHLTLRAATLRQRLSGEGA